MLRAAAFALVVVACVVAIGMAACTTSSGTPTVDASCPQDLPSGCTSAPPSYDAAIAPLIERRCLGCHGPGGVAYPQRDLSTYAQVYKRRGTALGQVYGCVMPPLDAGQLTSEERAELLQWFVCDAPNN